MYLVEPEATEWAPFSLVPGPCCQTSRQPPGQCVIFTPSQAEGLAQLSHFTAGFVTDRGPGHLEMICPALGHQDVLLFKEVHRQSAHLNVSSQDFEFIYKLIGVSSFKQKFENYFCYFGSCPYNIFY